MSLFLEVDTSSNAQDDQLNTCDGDQQHRQRHGIVFKPMPVIGKHDVHPVFNLHFSDLENRSAIPPPCVKLITEGRFAKPTWIRCCAHLVSAAPNLCSAVAPRGQIKK